MSLAQAAKIRIEALVSYLREHRSHLVIDTDTHPTDIHHMDGDQVARYKISQNYYHGKPISTTELLAEMDLAGVDMALSWQNPAVFSYEEDQETNFFKLLRANADIKNAGEMYPTRIIPAGWTDPAALGVKGACRLVDILTLEFGFCVIKMNPAQNAFDMGSDMVAEVVDHIIARGAVPTFHFGADTPYTPPSALEALAKRHPDRPLIAVHMGGGGAGYPEAEQHYQETRALGLRYPNLKFPLSARRDTHIESDLITYRLAGSPYDRNLFAASDAPYGRISWNFGGFRTMLDTLAHSSHPDPRVRENPELFGPEFKTQILGQNFADFLIEANTFFLQHNL